jgi:triacylglycerol lipase
MKTLQSSVGFFCRLLSRGAAATVLLIAAACSSDEVVPAGSAVADAGSLDAGSSGGSGQVASSSGQSSGQRSGVVDASVQDAGDAASSVTPAPYPIVFLHGMAGFDQLGPDRFALDYWRDLQEALKPLGELGYITQVTPFDDSQKRGRELEAQLQAILVKTGASKVNLVGHSQGGIDARFLASPAGANLGDRIASVTTIATPHRGSGVADATLATRTGSVASQAVSGFLSLLQKSVYQVETEANLRAQLGQLSSEGMREFNGRYTDDPRVRYESYAGRSNLRAGIRECSPSVVANEPLKVDATRTSLAATAAFLEEGLKVVVNDGLVTVESAKWGTFIGCIPADHLDQVGFPGGIGFDHQAFFRDVVKRIRQNGF